MHLHQSLLCTGSSLVEQKSQHYPFLLFLSIEKQAPAELFCSETWPEQGPKREWTVHAESDQVILLHLWLRISSVQHDRDANSGLETHTHTHTGGITISKADSPSPSMPLCPAEASVSRDWQDDRGRCNQSALGGRRWWWPHTGTTHGSTHWLKRRQRQRRASLRDAKVLIKMRRKKGTRRIWTWDRQTFRKKSVEYAYSRVDAQTKQEIK